jgi:Rieske 2Fe-2S family protein
MSTNKVKTAPEGIDATPRPFAEARPLPGPPYHEPSIFTAELERIFFDMWVCAGHQDNIAAAGDYMVREIGGECALIVRDKEGVPRAFYNVCRHRGTRLVDEVRGASELDKARGPARFAEPGKAGEPKSRELGNRGELDGSGKRGQPGGGLECIRCPYHGWSYGLDGRLLAAPLMDEVEGFDKRDYPLTPIHLDTWEGFLFLNFSEDPAPLAGQLAGFPDVSRFQMAQMRLGGRHEYDIAANWKLVCENYGECYHCPSNHPQLNPISHFRSGGNSFDGEGFCGGPMRLNEGCSTMTLTGRSERPPIAGLQGEDLRLVHYFNLYPAFLLSLHPDYVLTHTVWPIDAGRSRIVCEWLFPPQAVEAEGFDPSDAIEFWNMTNEQDWAICERAQKGVRSRGYRPGRYQRLEQTIYFFDSWYLQTMGSALRDGQERLPTTRPAPRDGPEHLPTTGPALRDGPE